MFPRRAEHRHGPRWIGEHPAPGRSHDRAAAPGYLVVPDMRGYNTSDAPQKAAYDLDTLAGDVAAIGEG